MHRLTRTLNAKPADGDTWRRRYLGLNTAVVHAVERGELDENPLKKIKARGRGSRGS